MRKTFLVAANDNDVGAADGDNVYCLVICLSVY